MTRSGYWNVGHAGADDGGLAPRALDAARAAARRAGMSLEQWLENAAPQAARDERHDDRGRGDLRDTISRLGTRLDNLIEQTRDTRFGLPQADLHRRLGDVASALDGLTDRLPAEARARSGGAFDGAVAEIAARRRMLDDREPSRRSPNRPPMARDDGGETLAQLRREMNDMARALADVAPRRSVETLDASVRALLSRVEAVRAPSIDTRALDDLTRMIVDVREGVRAMRPGEDVAAIIDEVRLLGRRMDTAQAGADGAALDRLSGQVNELRDLVGRTASVQDAGVLASEIRALAVKVDRVGSLASDAAAAVDLVAGLERRLDTLADGIASQAATGTAGVLSDIRDRLDGMHRALESTARAAPANVEGPILALVDKLDRLQGALAGGADTGALGRRLDLIVDRLDMSEQRLAQLGGIERGLNDLYAHLEETRATTLDAADRLARAASFAPGPDAEGPRSDEFRRGLSDLRAQQRDSETRTHETLEAVHGTLERVVDRLAMLEEDISRRAETPPPAFDDRLGARYAPAAPPPPEIAPSFEPEDLPPPPDRMPVAARLEAIPDLPPDFPLEPGSFAGAPGQRPSAAERIAASQDALGAVAPKPAPEPSSKASFIAAARRAAQQAVAEQGGKPAADAAPAGTRGGSFVANLRETIERRKKPIAIGLGLLLLAVGLPQALDLILPAEPPKPAVATPSQSQPPAPASPEPAPPAPGQQSALPSGDRSLASAPSSGLLGVQTVPAGGAPALPSGSFAPVAAPEQTSAINRPARNAAPQPAAQTAALAPAGFPGADELPATIGTPALRSAAVSGEPAAMFEIGNRFADGRGIAQNHAEAARWYERASAQGLAPAAYRLGSLHEKGNGVPKDIDKARRLYLQAADAGNAKAMHNLAVLMADGADGKPDYRAAAQWFRKAAERGVRDSQYNLAVLYARGLGLDQNLGESFKWFSLAASQGDTDAARKRDDVATRLDAQTLLAARLAVQTWQPRSTDDAANAVTLPPDWDRADAAPTQRQRRPATRG